MRQSAIPKLSKLKTAQRAELLKLWTVTLGSPPQFRASRELLASALAWQPAGAQVWRPQARHKAQAARNVARPGAEGVLKSAARHQSPPRHRDHKAVAGSAARGHGFGRWLSTPGHSLRQPLPTGPGDRRHALERSGFLSSACARDTDAQRRCARMATRLRQASLQQHRERAEPPRCS